MRGPEEAFKEKGEMGSMRGRGCKRGGGRGGARGERCSEDIWLHPFPRWLSRQTSNWVTPKYLSSPGQFGWVYEER